MQTPYYHRLLPTHIREHINAFPVIGITIHRQADKSTMLMHEFGTSYIYVTFDDQTRFMARYNHKIIFDEVQKVPEIFDAIKLLVDKEKSLYDNFSLTDPSQFNMLKSITESLADRIGLLTLLPLQYSEIPIMSHIKTILKSL